jgi:hypothetical protein
MILSKNGELFYLFKLKHPEIKLVDEEAHPTKAGAFLNAYIFYELFTNKKAKELEFLGNLDINIAVKLKISYLKPNLKPPHPKDFRPYNLNQEDTRSHL